VGYLASAGFEQFKSLIDLVAANEGVSTPSAPTDLGLCVAADETISLGPCIAADESP
jgi:hypothetical protein